MQDETFQYDTYNDNGILIKSTVVDAAGRFVSSTNYDDNGNPSNITVGPATCNIKDLNRIFTDYRQPTIVNPR